MSHGGGGRQLATAAEQTAQTEALRIRHQRLLAVTGEVGVEKRMHGGASVVESVGEFHHDGLR